MNRIVLSLIFTYLAVLFGRDAVTAVNLLDALAGLAVSLFSAGGLVAVILVSKKG